MTKSVRIAELKAHLSEHLRAASRGQVITVLDRDQPIAEIVPYRLKLKPVLNIRKGTGRLSDIEMPPPPKRKSKLSSLDILLEDRRRR